MKRVKVVLPFATILLAILLSGCMMMGGGHALGRCGMGEHASMADHRSQQDSVTTGHLLQPLDSSKIGGSSDTLAHHSH
jgi:hypothetical protein